MIRPSATVTTPRRQAGFLNIPLPVSSLPVRGPLATASFFFTFARGLAETGSGSLRKASRADGGGSADRFYRNFAPWTPAR